MTFTNSVFISFKDYQTIMANLRRVSEDSGRHILNNKLCLIIKEPNKLIFISTNGYIYAEHEVTVFTPENHSFNWDLYDKQFVIDIPPAIRLSYSSNVEIKFNIDEKDKVKIKFIFSGGLTLEPLNYMDYREDSCVFSSVRKSINEQRNTEISFKNSQEVMYNSQYLKRLLTGIDGKIYFEELPTLSGHRPMIIRSINRDRTISSTLVILPIRSNDNSIEKEFNGNVYPVIRRFEKEEVLNGSE